MNDESEIKRSIKTNLLRLFLLFLVPALAIYFNNDLRCEDLPVKTFCDKAGIPLEFFLLVFVPSAFMFPHFIKRAIRAENLENRWLFSIPGHPILALPFLSAFKDEAALSGSIEFQNLWISQICLCVLAAGVVNTIFLYLDGRHELKYRNV